MMNLLLIFIYKATILLLTRHLTLIHVFTGRSARHNELMLRMLTRK
jgi:hypothetical protein